MTETSTETLTERLKRQETERADEILKHAEQCSERVKSSTTQLYGSVERSILTDMARTRTLLRTYLFYSCLVAPTLALLIVVPVTWALGQGIVHLLEMELEQTRTELETIKQELVKHEQAMTESMMTLEPWGVTPVVAHGDRYLRMPGKAKPDLVTSKSGAVWFVKVGPAAGSQGRK